MGRIIEDVSYKNKIGIESCQKGKVYTIAITKTKADLHMFANLLLFIFSEIYVCSVSMTLPLASGYSHPISFGSAI